MDMSDFANGRTRGDGMEFVDTAQSDSRANGKMPTSIANFNLQKTSENRATSIPGATSIYRYDDASSKSIKLPVKMPQGKQFYLVPHLVNTKRTCSLKNKAPKFVPFEPYKAAVNPMVPEHSPKRKTNKKNNLDLNTLVSHVANLKTNEFNKIGSDADQAAATQQQMYEKQIVDLKKERDSYESQLKFQVQVNSELKNLLVAAVGEDLQTRVNVLTEDKLQLARALLSSAHNISSHTEQIEYLASQSEVWRSKFLASSLMVEELARWKANLMEKNKLLLQSNKQMLETMSQLRSMQANVLHNLKFLAQLKEINLPSSNLTDLTMECLNISDQLVLHSGIGMPENMDLTHLDAITESEKMAIDAIQHSNQTLMSSDAAHKAVVDQAFPPTRADAETQTSINDINNYQ